MGWRWVHLLWWLGGAETNVATTDGPPGEDRLLRFDRATGGFRNWWWFDYHAKRDGDTWILNGQKKWIGNAPCLTFSIIWARDLADNQVKGFIVETRLRLI